MNAVDIVRRGVWGLSLAILPVMGVSAAFHSLIQTRDNSRNAYYATAPNLPVFSMTRDWSVSLPQELAEKDAKRQAALQARVWTEEQNKELYVIASEALQTYARGGKDRRKHTSEKHMKFIETDSKLVIRVSVLYLSRSRRKLLGLGKASDAELVFIFTDSGGAFHPFHKVPGPQQAVSLNLQQNGTVIEHNGDAVREHRASASAGNSIPDSRPADRAGQSEEQEKSDVIVSDKHVSSALRRNQKATAKEVTDEQEEEERMTLLQLFWQNVAEPQHQELRRIAIENVLWDIGLSAGFLVLACVVTRLIGSANGRATAAALKRRRSSRFAAFRTNDLAIIPGLRDEVQTSIVGFDEFYPVEASRAATMDMQRNVPDAVAAAARQ